MYISWENVSEKLKSLQTVCMTGGMHHIPIHTNVSKFFNFRLTFSQLRREKGLLGVLQRYHAVVFRDPSCVAERRPDSIDIRMLDFSTLKTQITTQSQCTCYSIILKQSKKPVYVLWTKISRWFEIVALFFPHFSFHRSILPEIEPNRKLGRVTAFLVKCEWAQ